MRRGSLICLVAIFSSVLALANPLVSKNPGPIPTIPIAFAVSNKPVVFYLPNPCSGLIGDAVAGDGELNIFVQGRILNGQLNVHIKVECKGKAQTTVGNLAFSGSGALSVFESRAMMTEPLDIFVKGMVAFGTKAKAQKLFLSDLGYITVYPDGSVVNHIMDPNNDPSFSHPKVGCEKPAGAD